MMSKLLNAAMQRHFAIFLEKAFTSLNSEPFESHDYVEYLCYFAECFANGSKRFININLPPRHLKTFLFSKALPAWMIGHNPSEKLMIICGNEALAKNIAYEIRLIMRQSWYRKAFPARLAADHSEVFDFRTTQGGACFTATFGANFTGKGANKVIVDDVCDIKNAGNEIRLAEIRETFEPRIMSRLNNPRTSGLLHVGHRVDSNDLAGHLLRRKNFESVVLPLVATQSITFDYDKTKWTRRKGQLLQPNSRSKEELDVLRTNQVLPDFETLYQQNPDGTNSAPITTKCFRNFVENELPPVGLVMSVDAGQETGERNSYSVLQIWARKGPLHYLVEQRRERLEFSDLVQACRHFRQKYRPVAILIERAALGVALLSEGNVRKWKGLTPIIPDQRGKRARLRDHVGTILAKRILLPYRSPWVDDFVREVVEFPNGPFSDQVDAMTQYLNWIGCREELPAPGSRGLIAIGLHSQGSSQR
jgi:predicted phage terminase large subunit-like protein